MKHARRVFVRKLRIVSPSFGPIGAHRDECALRNGPVPGLPGGDVAQREHVIRILRDLVVHIDDDQRHQHVLEVDLIDAVQTGVEMSRWIDVSAPLTDMAVFVDPETILVHGVQGLHPLVGRTFPMRDSRRERVGKIDEAMGFQNRQRVRQCRVLGPRRGAGHRCKCRAHRTDADTPKPDSHARLPTIKPEDQRRKISTRQRCSGPRVAGCLDLHQQILPAYVGLQVDDGGR